MKTTFPFSTSKWVTAFLSLAGLLLAGSECSLADSGDRATELSIINRPANSGQIVGTRVVHKGETLYVTGSFLRTPGLSLLQGAHMDIEFIDRSGRLIIRKQRSIRSVHPQREQRQGRRYSFGAGFPVSPAEKADRIRVSFHSGPHS